MTINIGIARTQYLAVSLNYWYTHVGWENYAYNYKRQPIIEILNLY